MLRLSLLFQKDSKKPLPDFQPIRIAILLPSLQIGGAERLVVEELVCMKDDTRFAFELHIVFDKGPFFEGIATLGVPVHVWNAQHKSLSMLKSYAAIVQHLRRTRCQILHSHLLDSIGTLIGKMAGACVVSTVHNDIKYSWTERIVLGQSDLALACGQLVLRNISQFIPQKKIACLNNAIRRPAKQDGHRSEIFTRYGIAPGSLLILSLGRLTRQKGYDVLIEAFRLVAAELSEAVLMICGDGDEKSRLKQEIEAIGLQGRIKLPGMVNNIHEMLAACDLYVNSSRWEGLPMTLLEAMAHGKPIVATRVGGNPEAVRAGVTGSLVSADDPDSLAEAIIYLLRNDSFREKAGVAARDLFLREYTIERHCAALKNHYLRLVKTAAA
jgi:glycosyltransferase involved in cell wall biosynthesis